MTLVLQPQHYNGLQYMLVFLTLSYIGTRIRLKRLQNVSQLVLYKQQHTSSSNNNNNNTLQQQQQQQHTPAYKNLEMILKFLVDKNKNVKEPSIQRLRVELTFSLMFHRLQLSHALDFLYKMVNCTLVNLKKLIRQKECMPGLQLLNSIKQLAFFFFNIQTPSLGINPVSFLAK